MKIKLDFFTLVNPISITVFSTLLTIVFFMVGIPILDLIELKTYDLRFLSRGQRNPSNAVVMAVIDEKSLDGTGMEVSMINLNDGSVEGITHKKLPIQSVQFHPEANPGPWDCDNWFDDIAKMFNKKE